MSGQTLDQVRARYALEQVRRRAPKDGQKPNEGTRKYATHIRSVPSMVLQSGLGQAMAFLLADAEGDLKKPAGWLYEEIQGWLCGPRSPERPERVYVSSQDLMQALVAGSRSDYQRAQEASLALLAWMRKFADAYLRSEE